MNAQHSHTPKVMSPQHFVYSLLDKAAQLEHESTTKHDIPLIRAYLMLDEALYAEVLLQEFDWVPLFMLASKHNVSLLRYSIYTSFQSVH